MEISKEEMRIILKAMEYTRPKVQEMEGFNKLARRVFEGAGYSASGRFCDKIYEREVIVDGTD